MTHCILAFKLDQAPMREDGNSGLTSTNFKRVVLREALKTIMADPQMPVQPARPAQIADPARPAPPVQPPRPAHPVQPAQPAQPASQVQQLRHRKRNLETLRKLLLCFNLVYCARVSFLSLVPPSPRSSF